MLCLLGLSALNSTKGKDKLYFFSYFDPSKPYQEAIRKYAPIEIRSSELKAFLFKGSPLTYADSADF